MKNGVWSVEKRFLALEDPKNAEFAQFAGKFFKANKRGSKYFPDLAKAVVKRIVGSDRLVVRGSGKILSATVVYISRSGHLKFFDFDKNEILTTIDRNVHVNRVPEKKLALFDYFPRPDRSLIKTQSGYFRREPLLEAKPLGLLSQVEQLKSVHKIIKVYEEYVEATRCEPDPDLVMTCFKEVAQYLPEAIRAKYLALEKRVSSLAKRYGLVEAHLDFNIANLLINDRVWAVDTEDAGLLLPCLYDLNNLAINEIYEDRDTFIFDQIFGGALNADFRSLMSKAIIGPNKDDDKLSVFMNFFMRESQYVSSQLFGDIDPKRAEWTWNKLERAIPWWGQFSDAH
ncbi:hypothetical protein [Aestuariivita boseongensis]|uniref:hypothetical protein n=1 Tax=Aestuariivita boseongensis TaxID=1470562 RepID=UPI00155DD271|nr:hypothetical protein [Aestuariivita boseongensis]